VMGKSHPDAPHPYLQQSVILVPANTPGITIERMLTVFGYDDAPHGHAEMVFNNVRVPESNMILGPGRGFETVQGRLGPGRLHHCMRAIGVADRALEEFIARVNDPNRETFGMRLNRHGVILDWIAKSRIDIDAARLMVLNAAIKTDQTDAKDAQREIGMAKIHVPKVCLKVIDRAIQAHGAAGLGPDTPLPAMYAIVRALRIADGPDEVHLMQLGRNESKTGKEMIAKIQEQKRRTAELFKAQGVKAKL
jgi:acyl-CoA dehydrogenase